MIGQNDNKLLPSFALYLDHLILAKGRAFNNYSGQFYPQTSQYSNHYIFASPFAQLVYDSSISGANANNQIYVNNQLINTGVSGFLGIDYQNGRAIFSSNISNASVSGHYSVKEINIKLTQDAEESILFKTKYQLKPKYPQTITGIANDTVTYPIIYIRDDFSESVPHSFGGVETVNHTIRCIVLADSLFNLHAIQSICRDNVRTLVPLFEASEMPFSPLGTLRSGVYNYNNVRNTKINEGNYAFIEKVRIPRQSQSYTVGTNQLNPDIFFNFIDFEISTVGNWRYNS